MFIIKEYIECWDDDEKEKFIDNYEEFKRKGYIDECPLRNHAKFIQKHYFNENMSITTIMVWLASETAFYFTKKYLNKEN